MKTNTATALRLETTTAAKFAEMHAGAATAMMSSAAQPVTQARADMISGDKTCMMSSAADL